MSTIGLQDLVVRLANGDTRVSNEEILASIREAFPRAPRGALLPSTAALMFDAPPAGLEGIRWSDDALHPTEVEQVQRIVIFAKTHHRRVRTAGAQHSTPPAVYSSDPREIRMVLDGSLRGVDFTSQEPGGATVMVGAGCYLGVNPSDHTSTRENSLTYILDTAGYALPILGGISHQTVGGFLQTGSAGGSLKHGFADAVQAIEVVDGTGTVRWFQRGSDGFAAVGVAMGLLGVVTHVVLSVEPRYFVQGEEGNVRHEDSLLQKVDDHYPLADALGSTEYLHLNWFPQADVRRVTQWNGQRTEPVDHPQPYKSTLKDGFLNVVAAMVLSLTSGLLALDPSNPIVAKIVGFLLRQFVPLDNPQEFVDTWWKVLPCDDQVQVDTLIKIIFTEIWLPLDQLTSAVDRLEEAVKNQRVAGNFAIEFYGGKESPFWLSPSFGADAVRVDVFWWAYSFGDPREHFAHFWKALLELDGARFHWGKHLPDVGVTYGSVTFGPDLLERRYGRLVDWKARRQELDPDGVFANEYWTRVLGL